MEKKEIIKRLIDFLKSITKRCLIFDTDYNEGMPKLLLNILVKEFADPINIAFISPSDKFFSEIFPKAKDGIKVNTKYSVGAHNISFYLLEKNLIRKPPEDSEIIIIYPIDGLKDKDILKLIDGCKKMRKVILIANSISDIGKYFKKLNPNLLSLKASEDTAYYDIMKQKLFDIK